MKHLSLNKRRIIILLTPVVYAVIISIISLISFFVDNSGVVAVLTILTLFLSLAVVVAFYYMIINYWRCPHCDKHLMHWLPMLFIGWAWLLLHTPKECNHCGKAIDFKAAKKKEKKLPEWAQKFEDKDKDDENGYYRH